VLEENINTNLHDLGFDNGFLNRTPKVHITKNRFKTIGLHQD
jgi:hypothetical protein